MTLFDTDNPILNFGKHKGRRVKDVPIAYLEWIKETSEKSSAASDNTKFDHSLIAAIDRRIAGRLQEERKLKIATALLAGQPLSEIHDADIAGAWIPGATAVYVVEIDRIQTASKHADLNLSIHQDLHKALKAIDISFRTNDARCASDNDRTTPDPEDDLIVVWEVLPSGHRKAVWAFIGWHHSVENYHCGQGSLPGDSASLYSRANE